MGNGIVIYKAFLYNKDTYDIRFCNYDETERENGEFIITVSDDKELSEEIVDALNHAYQRGMKAGRS